MRVESDDRYPRPVPEPPPDEDHAAMGCLGITIALVVSLAMWYFGWHLVRWLFS